jgi:hypothetical protein
VHEELPRGDLAELLLGLAIAAGTAAGATRQDRRANCVDIPGDVASDGRGVDRVRTRADGFEALHDEIDDARTCRRG